MNTLAKLILCLGLALSFNTFAACPSADECTKCAADCAGKADCPEKSMCDSCKSDECKAASPASH